MTTRAIAIVAAIAAAAAFALWNPHRNDKRSASSDDRAATALASPPQARLPNDSADARPETARPPTIGLDMIAHDPDAAARFWTSRAKDVLRKKARKEYGDEVARLLELPYDEAWPLLAEKAKGDLRAAAAASFIHSICAGEATRAGPRGRERPASSYYKNLPDAMKPFVDSVAALRTKDYEESVARCDGIARAPELVSTFFDNFFRSDNIEAEIEVAGENKDKPQAIADLRAILEKQDYARGRFYLGDILLQSDDATERAEGRAMLERLALGDPEVANRLAYCLRGEACGSVEPDPAAANAWFETSAGLGDQGGLSETEHRLADAGDNAGAWAWSLYALDLALDGCFETIYPSHRYIAHFVEAEAQRKAGLTPAEQNAGLAISYAIEGRWEKQAKERLACD